MPKVSVIVPNYNHSQFLSERLDSIINQTYKDFELIILDDASTDNSIDVINQYLNKYPELIRFQPSTYNSGSPFVQWDNGIKLAKGEFVWIAESDDVASINFLNEMVRVLEQDINLAIVVCLSNAINTGSETINDAHPVYFDYINELFHKSSNEINLFEGKSFIQNYLVQRCLIPNVSGILIRKSKYLHAGGVDKKFNRSGDYDLYVRMLEVGDVAFINKQLNSTRYHQEKLTTNNNTDSLKETFNVVKYIFKRYKISNSVKKKVASFYFTVYKYDIFLNKKTSLSDKSTVLLRLIIINKTTINLMTKLLYERLKIRIMQMLG